MKEKNLNSSVKEIKDKDTNRKFKCGGILNNDKHKKYQVKGTVADADKKPDMVNKPPHYNRPGAMQCLDEMEMIFGKEEVAIFCKLNAWKYRYRAYGKNGEEDIAKSDFYINKYKELKKSVTGLPAKYTYYTTTFSGDCKK